MFLFQITKIILGSIIFMILFSIAVPMTVEGDRAATSVLSSSTATSLPEVAEELRGEVMRLVGPRQRIDLRERPAGLRARFTAEAGALARVADATTVGETVWFLVRLEANRVEGWVASENLILPATAGPGFGGFRFCAGDRVRPTTPCSDILSVPVDALWLQWEYSGLKKGDVLQRVLLVNDKRYPSPPVIWHGPPAGRKLVDLIGVHQPRMETGEWIVRFVVNGEFAGEAHVQLR